MKTFFSLITLLLLHFCAAAQLQVPKGTPGKVPLPNPHIPPLQPADLVITGISFVSLELLTTKKMYRIKVNVTMRNAGVLQSAKTQLGIDTKTPAGSGSWHSLSVVLNVPAINGGSSYTTDYTFEASALAIGSARFDLRAKVDAGNLVVEKDETNNYSATISINPGSH